LHQYLNIFMKFLHIISSVNPKGGGPIEGIRQLHRPISQAGNSVDVVCGDAPDAPWLASTGLSKIYALGPSYCGYGYCPKLVPWLRANATQYDAIIVNGLWQYISFAAWRAFAGTKVPYFVFTHGMLDPWFKYTYPFKHLKKWLYWPWAEYRVLRDARAVIFTCEDERLLARQSFWLYRANEAVTSYGTSSPPANGDEYKNKFLDANTHLRGKRLVLFLSRIQEKKGCDLLINAFAQVANKDKNLHLVMAGPDQAGWVATLQAQAAKLGVADRISWPGMLQGDMKWGAFYAAEVFCLPSHQENFGIVVAEALACGKPVLISNKVNIWREIETDTAGLVDSDTVDGTVRNLERWLVLSAPEYEAMANQAVKTFETRFHIDRAAQRLLEIIREFGR
jgi:glycosyltransferase involved in cell wall biosynthesis